MSETHKYQILKELSENIVEPDLNKIYLMIFDAVKNKNPESLDYFHIVKFGASKKDEKLFDMKKFDKLLELCYSHWWNEYLIKNEKNFSPYLKDIVKTNLYDNPHYNLYSDERYKIKHLIRSIDYNDKLSLYFPVIFQSVYFCQFFLSSYKDLKDLSNFNHFDMRLYLETDIKNMPELATDFAKYIVRHNLTFTFKCALTKRSDSFVFYVPYENLKDALNMIDEVKQKKPELFKKCKVTNPLLASYKGYVGLGEEPFALDSYNNIRSTIMLKTYKIVLKMYQDDCSALTLKNIADVFNAECEKKYIDPKKFYINKNPFNKEKELTM